jgi:hypothetical protein
MKWLVRAAIGFAVLSVLVLVLLAVVLPRVAGSAAVRARIEAAARDALGREVSFASLETGMLPPSLRVVAPRVAGATPDAAPLLEAERVSLRVALLPLLTGSVAVDSFVVEGATLRLTRTREGFDLPTLGSPEPDAPTPAGEPPAGEPSAGSDDAGSDAAVDLAVRRVRLRDSTVVLEDRSVSPAVTWELRDVGAEATGRLLSERIDLEASASLASGGAFRLDGSSTRAGELDLDLALDALALAPLAPYLEGIDSLSGVVSGKLRLAGPARDPERVSAELDFERLDLRRGELRVAGPLGLQAELASPLAAASGDFSADAGGAEIEFGDSFHKPAGTAARISGRIAPGPAGALAVEDLVVALRNLDLRGRVAQLSPLQVELRSESFEVDGWQELLPGLAAASPSGSARVESLAYTAEPQALHGRVLLDGIETRRADQPPVMLRGAVVAQGQSLQLEDAKLAASGQEIHLDARLDDLFGAPHYRFALDAAGTDANKVVSAFLGKRDALFGLLGLQANFAGPLGGDLLQSMKGRAGFGVDEGRLAGVSLLRAAIERLGSAGQLALDLGRTLGGRDLQRFYGDAFETLRGTFDVQGGVARTDDLTFVYRGYGVVLRGTLGLADLALDTKGELTLEEEVDGVIAKELGLKSYTPVRRIIPLANVGGSLDAPQIEISPRTAAALAAAYAAPKYADDLRERAEDVLGEGGGEVVDEGLRVLDNLLGGGHRERSAKRPEATSDSAETPANGGEDAAIPEAQPPSPHPAEGQAAPSEPASPQETQPANQ